MRDALLDSLSHDLRTPLSSIAGAASSLRALGDKMSPAERLELLSSIEDETGRLARFVANLLDMSRIEAGGLKVNRDLVSIADVVQGAVERSRKAFPGEPVRVSLAPNLPFVRGDDKLLEQVLFNLLDNAHKYAGEAGAIVHARQEGDEVVLSVTDEGPGIKPAELERIFEKFYRGGRPDGRKAGTGLGLSISRRLVEAMGGTIVAQSPAVRRRGTRFVVRLPAAQATSRQRRARPHDRPARSGGRRRAADSAVSHRRAHRRRLSGANGRDRRSGLASGGDRRARSHRSRPRPARSGRQGRSARHPPVLDDAGDRALRARSRGGEDRGARSRRRRLCREAFRHRRTDRAAQGGAATRGASRPSRFSGWRSKASSWISTSVSSPATGRRSS